MAPHSLVLALALLANVAAAGKATVKGHPALYERYFKVFHAPIDFPKDVVPDVDGDLSEWPDGKCFVFWPEMRHKEMPPWCLENWMVDEPFGSKTGVHKLKFEKAEGGVYGGDLDQSAAVGFAWDADNFYVRASVRDDYFQSNCGSGNDFVWDGDSMQLMFTDAERADVGFLYNVALYPEPDCDGQTHIQYEQQPACDEDENGMQACGARAPIEAAVIRDDEVMRTNYEVKIPAVWLGRESFEAGEKLGVAVAMNDGDAGNRQDGQSGWSGVAPDAIVYEKEPEKAMLVVLDEKLYQEGIPPML